MFNYKMATSIIKEAPGIIASLKSDLESGAGVVSQRTLDLINDEIYRQERQVKEAELSLKFQDYQ